MKNFFHISGQLPIPVFIFIPVKQRCIEWNLKIFLRIIRISHHDWVTFYHRTHGLAGFFCIFRRDSRNRRHKYAVHFLFCQISQMSVHQFCRKTNGVGSNCRQTVFINFSCAWVGNLYLKSKCTPKCGPERHRFPIRKHPWKPNRNPFFRFHLCVFIILKQQFFPITEQIGHFILFLLFFFQLQADFFVFDITQHFAALTTVVGNPGPAV